MAEESDSPPSAAEMFEVLAEQRRLSLVFILALAGQSTTSVRYLAEMLAVVEGGTRPRQLDAESYRLTRQSLVRGHLNVLDEADVITRDDNTIAAGPRFNQYCRLALAYFWLPTTETALPD